jgi:hypothetical protein
MLTANPDSFGVEPVASSSTFARKPKMVVLFRRYDAFFPMLCLNQGRVSEGDACLALMPKAPTVRLATGKKLTLKALASHGVSAWEKPDRKGWALPSADPEAPRGGTELAVWPADASPGFEPVAEVSHDVPLDGLQEVAKPRKHVSVSGRPAPPWPPTIEQAVAAGGTTVVLSGALGGLFQKSAEGWRAVRAEGLAETGTFLFGRMDLDGDGAPEWLVYVRGWNEFGLEVRSADFSKTLFEFNDCGV